MTIAKLAVLLGAIALASGGIGAALAETRSPSSGGVEPIDIEARKNDDGDDGVLLFAGDEDDDDRDGTGGNDGTGGGGDTRDATNGTSGATGVDASRAEGRSAAQWMASAQLYKERWLQMKKANERHAQQVRNLRAAVRNQTRSSARPRSARSGGSVVRSGGSVARSGGTNTGGGSVSGGGDT